MILALVYYCSSDFFPNPSLFISLPQTSSTINMKLSPSIAISIVLALGCANAAIIPRQPGSTGAETSLSQPLRRYTNNNEGPGNHDNNNGPGQNNNNDGPGGNNNNNLNGGTSSAGTQYGSANGPGSHSVTVTGPDGSDTYTNGNGPVVLGNANYTGGNSAGAASAAEQQGLQAAAQGERVAAKAEQQASNGYGGDVHNFPDNQYTEPMYNSLGSPSLSGPYGPSSSGPKSAISSGSVTTGNGGTVSGSSVGDGPGGSSGQTFTNNNNK